MLTTREINRTIHAEHTLVSELQEEELSISPSVGTSAVVIFGITDDVVQVALRSAYYLMTRENPDPEAFPKVGSMQG